MELHPDEPRVVGPFDDFGEQAIGRHAREHQALRLQPRAVADIDFIAVAVAFADLGAVIDRGGNAVACQPGFIGAESHRAAHVAAGFADLQTIGTHPFSDHADHGFIGRAEFGGAGAGHAGLVARRFDTGHLHAKADAEKRHFAFAGKAHTGDLAFGTAFAKAAGHQDAVHRFEPHRDILALEFLGIEPLDIDLDAVGDAAMDQRFGERFIGILHARILADDADGDFAFGIVQRFADPRPAGQHRRRGVGDAERCQHLIIQPFGVILQRHVVNARRIERGDDGFLGDIAEQCDLGAITVGQRMFGAADQHMRLDADTAQFGNAVLGRLGLQFPRRRQIGNQRAMDIDGVGAADIGGQLPNRLEERQRFDIADGAADFAQHEIKPVGFSAGKGLDGIGDVRDDLNRRAEKLPLALLGDDVLIDSPRGDIVGLPRRDAGKAFVMAEIEIGLGAIVGHIDFAMLIGRHRAGIDVEIRIELADADRIATRLKQCGQRGGHQALAKRRDHAAGDENKPGHGRKVLAPITPPAPVGTTNLLVDKRYSPSRKRSAAPASGGAAATWPG